MWSQENIQSSETRSSGSTIHSTRQLSDFGNCYLTSVWPLCRYVHEKGCVATTGDITVSVSTSFLPELSSVHPPHFFFTYRIRWVTFWPFVAWVFIASVLSCNPVTPPRIEMSSSASPDAACQLDSRYWKITTSDGNVEEVQGPGVVGTLPCRSPPPHTLNPHSHCLRWFADMMSPYVGEFPVMTPGKIHEYASCTTFSTPSEFMEGYYTFHRLG